MYVYVFIRFGKYFLIYFCYLRTLSIVDRKELLLILLVLYEEIKCVISFNLFCYMMFQRTFKFI